MDLSKTPLALNPSGAPPNFVDPPSLNNALLGSGISVMAIATGVLFLRIYANIKYTGRLVLEDVLCIISWATSVSIWAVTYSLAADGVARHAWDIPLAFVNAPYMKRTFALEMIGTVAMWSGKACILALFLRIFESVRWMRLSCYILLILMGIFYITSIAIWIVNCVPHSGQNWSSPDLITKSASTPVISTLVATGAVSVAVDCTMFVLPFPIIARLHLDGREKIRLMIVFSVALCTVVAACASLAYRIKYAQGMKGDVTFAAMNVLITSIAELFGTVIVSCAPALSSFWYNIFVKTRLYLVIHSRISRNRNHTRSKIIEDTELQQYGSDKYYSNVEAKKNDPYTFTEAGLQSEGSEDCIVPRDRPSSGFITSAITLTTHIETRSEPR